MFREKIKSVSLSLEILKKHCLQVRTICHFYLYLKSIWKILLSQAQ